MTFRIEPAMKEALRAATAREHRSIANMVEVLILGYCEQHGIAIPTRNAAKSDAEKKKRAPLWGK